MFIDINCDLGESFGRYSLAEDEEILKFVTSVNIACGFHAGDPTVMRQTVERALKYNIGIGAHPGLPDLVGFGRRHMQITPKEAYDLVVYQVGSLQAFLTIHNKKMQHVKPHGALYNMAAVDYEIASAIAQAVYDISPELILFGLSNSELSKAASEIGLRTAQEVFADRTYQADGSLTPRNNKNALITDADIAIKQVIRMIEKGEVETLQGKLAKITANTICVHGDGRDALEFVKNINKKLSKHKIQIKPVEQWL